MNLKTLEMTSDAEMEADGALEGNEALIYGSDYAELEEAISNCLGLKE